MTPSRLARCAALAAATIALAQFTLAEDSAQQHRSGGDDKPEVSQQHATEEEEPYYQAKPVRRYTSGKVRLDRFGRPREGHSDSVPSHDSPAIMP